MVTKRESRGKSQWMTTVSYHLMSSFAMHSTIPYNPGKRNHSCPYAISQTMCKSKFQTNAHGCYVSPAPSSLNGPKNVPVVRSMRYRQDAGNSIRHPLSFFSEQSLPSSTLRRFAQEPASDRHSGEEHHHPREDPVVVALLGGTNRARALGASLSVPPRSRLLRRSRRNGYRLDERAGSG